MGHDDALAQAWRFAREEEEALAKAAGRLTPAQEYALIVGGGGLAGVAATLTAAELLGSSEEDEKVPVPSPMDRMLPDGPTK
jgi:NADH dehydrogenase FAD-containing subunit